jgi:hypothetical protein
LYCLILIKASRSFKSIKNENSRHLDGESDKMTRCNSSGKVMLMEYLNQNKKNEKNSNSHNVSRDHSNVNKSYTSTVSGYLDRRHMQEKEKIEKLRLEKFIADTDNLRFTPTISKNSRKIIENIAKRENYLHEERVKHAQAVPVNNFRKEFVKKKVPVKKKTNEVDDYRRLYENRENLLRERDYMVNFIIYFYRITAVAVINPYLLSANIRLNLSREVTISIINNRNNIDL